MANKSDDLRPDGWWRSAVVYQIYPRAFQDSNEDGVGDLGGIISRLGYLEELGVDVIWVSPVYRSPQRDNGYDISDYHDVDEIFGSLADLDALIAAAHEHRIRVVMDLVVNHTSDQHPWFLESRDPSSPKRDWYFWRGGRPGLEPGAPGAEPFAAQAAFAPSAWTFDEASGEYYFGTFSPYQPDLNWENEDARQAIYAMMRWWVERGVDGFRMDVINLISKSALLTTTGPQSVDRVDFPDLLGSRLDEFLSEMNREVGIDEQRLLTVGEMPGSTVETAVRATDPGRHELNMVFTFEHVDLDTVPGEAKWNIAELPLPVLKKNLAKWQAALADAGWNSLYFNNHDQPRAVSRFGDDRPEHRTNSAKTLATVLHMHKGTPYIYQGEELGMTNASFTAIEEYQDLESLAYHAAALANGVDEEEVLRSLAVKSRDHARTPMQWDDSLHAGFSTGTPVTPVNPNHVVINAAAQRRDPRSVFQHFRRLIDLRHTSEVVREGRFDLLVPEHEQIWAFTRTLGDRCLLIIANCSSTPAIIPFAIWAAADRGTALLATHDSDSHELAPWESRVISIPARPTLGSPAGMLTFESPTRKGSA